MSQIINEKIDQEQNKQVKLSHIGVKKYLYLKNSFNYEDNGELELLKMIFNNIHVFYDKKFDSYIQKGFLQYTQDDISITKRYYDYPFLEKVKKIHYEITSECNFRCDHCRSGNVVRVTEDSIEKLFNAADIFIDIGIKRFDFIGGEVTLYGGSWLELVKHIKQKCNDSIITVYTNGWFLEKKDFMIDNKVYKNDEEYFTHLKENGLTHILFSIDAPEQEHDANRHHQGLYQKILNSIERVIDSGLKPRISTIIFKGKSISHLALFSKKIYQYDFKSTKEALQKLQSDNTNHFSNFIDINNGSKLRKGLFHVKNERITKELIRCKAFYRPSPTLRIRADGSIGICPLMNQDELYGNINDKSTMDIINNVHKTFSYQLHSKKLLSNYIPYLHKGVLEKFDHLCTLRIALHKLALAFETIGVKDVTKASTDEIKEANKLLEEYF